MRAFPDVKVILTTRDPRTWYRSIKKLYDGHCLVETTWSFPLVTRLLDGRRDRDRIFGQTKTFNPWSFVPEGMAMSLEEAVQGGPDTAVNFFTDWAADVVRSVPESQLLVFDPRDGWAPLCRFLGVKEVPAGPYPFLNEGSRLDKAHGHLVRLDRVLVILTGVILGLMAWLLYCWSLGW